MKTKITIQQLMCWTAIAGIAQAGECIFAVVQNAQPIRNVTHLTPAQRIQLLRKMCAAQVAA
jgi:hypothetical protein